MRAPPQRMEPPELPKVLRSVVTGVGGFLPERIVTNDELSRIVETSDEWIRERTGICQRYIAGEGETTGTLATAAARAALADAGMTPAEVDLIVLATATPDRTFPATATLVQDALGCDGAAAFDVAAVCSGFLYALATADSMIRTGMARRALVIGAETFSRILDWEDRATCVLFGDGAGAMVLAAEVLAWRSTVTTTFSIGRPSFFAVASRIRRLAWCGTTQSMSLAA